MARILFVNQYYPPDVASTGQHLADLAEHLSGCGHEVRVLCSRGRYLEGKGEAPVHEVRNGVAVHRLGAMSFGKRWFVGRFLDYLSYHLLVGVRLATSTWADVVVTLTTPPLVGIWGSLARTVTGCRHVCFVMDLHPDAEFELGMLRRGSIAGRLLSFLDSVHLRRADVCVALGPHQARRIVSKGVATDRVVEIPIWNRKDEIVPLRADENPLRKRLGWQDRFVAMYSGNAGLAHTFDDFLEAATILSRSDPEVLFAFVGKGVRTAEIRAIVAERKLENVSFYDYFPRDELRYSLPAADVHLISLREEMAGIAVPSKIYAALASGRPVLFAGPDACEATDAVRESGAGVALGLGRGADLAQEILRLKHDPRLASERGRKGRDYFLRVHEQHECCELWRELLEEVCAARRRTPALHVESAVPDHGRG